MPRYGQFETTPETPATSAGASVFKAKGPKGPAVVSVFHALTPAEAESRLAAIRRQERAAASGSNLAPVLEAGLDVEGAWCATPAYPMPVSRLLRQRTKLKPEQLVELLVGVCNGAAALHRLDGQPHGGIFPANVHLEVADVIQRGGVRVGMPAPTGSAIPDARAIGRLLYQLVRRQELDDEAWAELVLPLVEDESWKAMFGVAAPRWVEFANRLLGPDAAAPDAAEAIRLLGALQPRRVFTPGRVALVLLLLLGAGGGGWWWWKSTNTSTLTVATNLPDDPSLAEATLVLTPGAGGPERTQPIRRETTLAGLAPGGYRLVVRHPLLGSRTNSVTLIARQTGREQVEFEFGQFKVSSTPANARVKFRQDSWDAGWPEGTLVTRLPGEVGLDITLLGHQPETIRLRIPPFGLTNLTVPLRPNEAGKGNLAINGPAGTVFRWQADGQERFATNFVREHLREGMYAFVASNWPWAPISFQTNVTAGANQELNVRFPYGTLEIGGLDGTSLYFGTNRVNFEIGPIPRELQWPPGEVTFELRKDGYETNRITVTLVEGGTVATNVFLKGRDGFIHLAANLPGVRVRSLTQPEWSWTIGTNLVSTNLLFGTNTLVFDLPDDSREGILTPVTNAPFFLEPGGRYTNAQVRLEFAEVRFDATPAGSILTVAGREFTNAIPRWLVPPGTEVLVAAIAPYHDPTNALLQAVAGNLRSARLTLQPTLYPIEFTVDPPGTVLRSPDGSRTYPAGVNRLPWGASGEITLVASFDGPPALEPVRQTVRFTTNGASGRWVLSYGTLDVETAQPNLDISLDGVWLGRTTPAKGILARPGAHQLRLAYKRRDDLTTNFNITLPEGVAVPLPDAIRSVSFLPRRFANSRGMTMIQVSGGIYVAQTEVAENEYYPLIVPALTKDPANAAFVARLEERLNAKRDSRLPARADGDADGDPSAPSFAAALRYCELLTTAPEERAAWERAGLPGEWKYDLPTDAEWSAFGAPDLDAGGGNFSRTDVWKVDDPRLTPNKLGLVGLYGNVSEWARGQTERVTLGGSFDSANSAANRERRFRYAESSPLFRNTKVFDVGGQVQGFRVVLRPAGP